MRAIADLERGRTRRPYPSSVRALVARARAAGRGRDGAGRAVPRRRRRGRRAWRPGQPRRRRRPRRRRSPLSPAAADAGAALRGAGRRTARCSTACSTRRLRPGSRGHRGGDLRDRRDRGRRQDRARAALGAPGRARASPTGSSTPTCAGSTPRTAGPPTPPTCCAASSTRSACTRSGCRPTPRGSPRCTASVLAGRRMLVLLDNAADVAQVRPLLPASPRLPRHRHQPARAGRARRARGRPAAPARRAERAGGERAARRAARHRSGRPRSRGPSPSWPRCARGCRSRCPWSSPAPPPRPSCRCPSLAAELTELGGRLDALDVGDPAANVRTVLSLSYRHLPDTAARMFRLLGLHPGPDISAAAAASLAGVPLAAGARRAARPDQGVSCSWRSRPAGTRSTTCCGRTPPSRPTPGPRASRTPRRRMLDHYLHTAHRAHRVLYPGRELIDLDALRPWGHPGDVRRQGVRARLAARPSTRCCSR